MLALITNDDGFDSEGIQKLSREIAKVCDILIVAPLIDQSASSHSLTLQRPLRMNKLNSHTYTVDGTPTDAVMVAMYGVLEGKTKPDILLSGINRGSNMGDDVTYSGTVSAAFEGAILGIPSIALSSVEAENIDYLSIARFARKLTRKVLTKGLPRFSLLNVNAPNPARGGYKGVQITRLGKRVYRDLIVESIDPRGKKYYWIAGEPDWQEYDQSDYTATKNGYISITPLKMDMTDYTFRDELKGWNLKA